MLSFVNEEQLDNYLCEPSERLLEDLARLDGDFMVLGAGGKIGPTLSCMLKRACVRTGKNAKVYAVSRFHDPYVLSLLQKENVTMLSADLSDEGQVAELPKVKNIIYLLGRKFGTSGAAYDTWHTNVVLPAMLLKHLGAARYVVFSSGNVYPFTEPGTGGCTEDTAPDPVGEYAMSCLGRERVFEYAAKHCGAKVLLFRLNYAVDLRYGVLHDLARTILEGRPVSLDVPAFNCVSQRYVCEVAIRSLHLADENAQCLNVTGREIVSTRKAAQELASAMGREAAFTGVPGKKALLSNAQKCISLFGEPDLSIWDMIPLQAQWVMNAGRSLGKPTHFEEKEGKF